MSDRHKEALAHLTYGLSETGGFALLTGEVGTGKTTISRCLLEQLPENTQTAFILNPTLSSLELLATICDQLTLNYDKSAASLKTLTDKIFEKLLQNHQANINTVLIIDEAQHLQVEVLEQLRLLTNLETDTKKLLQVILIGQPELQQLLQRRDLRQLAQRITARYHLMPLTKAELALYVKHRLYIAGCQRVLFNAGALAKIHQLSQGIPRLINLLCHSALMHAYNNNDTIVSKKAVQKAAEHTLGDELYSGQKKSNSLGTVLATCSVITGVIAIGAVSFWLGQSESPLLVTPSLLSDKAVIEEATITEPLIELTATKNVYSEHSKSNENIANEPSAVQNTSSSTSSNSSEIAALLSVEQESSDIANVAPVDESGNESIRNAKAEEQSSVDDSSPVEKTDDYQVEGVDGTSPELLALFQAAVKETQQSANGNNHKPVEPAEHLSSVDRAYQKAQPLTQLSASFQQSLPSLHFTQHIYSSDGQGWVNVNGRDRYEGDSIANGLILEKILPQQVILTYQEQTFTMPALVHW